MEVTRKHLGLSIASMSIALIGAALYAVAQTHPSAANNIMQGLVTQVVHIEPGRNGLGSVKIEPAKTDVRQAAGFIEQAGYNWESPFAGR